MKIYVIYGDNSSHDVGGRWDVCARTDKKRAGILVSMLNQQTDAIVERQNKAEDNYNKARAKKNQEPAAWEKAREEWDNAQRESPALDPGHNVDQHTRYDWEELDLD